MKRVKKERKKVTLLSVARGAIIIIVAITMDSQPRMGDLLMKTDMCSIQDTAII